MGRRESREGAGGVPLFGPAMGVFGRGSTEEPLLSLHRNEIPPPLSRLDEKWYFQNWGPAKGCV